MDSASHVGEYVEYAKTHGFSHCGICDHGLALGLHELINKCNKNGIIPICGIEFYLAPRHGYAFQKKPYEFGHISLWAMGGNSQGYKNLITLASRSWMPERVVKRYGKPKPRITWDDIAAFNEGLLCGSGCIEGPIAKPLLRGEVDEAILNASVLNEIFGDRLYFEVMPHAVDRDYVKDQVITVKDLRGTTYTFLPTDTVETHEGRITIAEAMQRQVTDIWDPIPNRFQERRILSPEYDNIRTIDNTDLSVNIEHAGENGEEHILSPITPRNIQMPPNIENADQSDDLPTN